MIELVFRRAQWGVRIRTLLNSRISEFMEKRIWSGLPVRWPLGGPGKGQKKKQKIFLVFRMVDTESCVTVNVPYARDGLIRIVNYRPHRIDYLFGITTALRPKMTVTASDMLQNLSIPQKTLGSSLGALAGLSPRRIDFSAPIHSWGISRPKPHKMAEKKVCPPLSTLFSHRP